MTRDEEALIRSRQAARARVTALVLGAFVILIFGIAIAKMGLRG